MADFANCPDCEAIRWGNATCATCRLHWQGGDPVVTKDQEWDGMEMDSPAGRSDFVGKRADDAKVADGVVVGPDIDRIKDRVSDPVGVPPVSVGDGDVQVDEDGAGHGSSLGDGDSATLPPSGANGEGGDGDTFLPSPAPGMVECPACDGVGAQYGAHIDGIAPCPTCAGSGLVQSQGTASQTMIHGTAT